MYRQILYHSQSIIDGLCLKSVHFFHFLNAAMLIVLRFLFHCLGVPLWVGLSLQVLAALRAFRYYPSRGFCIKLC